MYANFLLAELTITLRDVDDNHPMFIPSSTYFARISEASRSGIEVKQIQAIDIDKVPGEMEYYVVSS